MPASISPASVSDHGATNKDVTKVERLRTGFARANFSTVISPTMFFTLLFVILALYFIVSLFQTLLLAVADFTWEDETSRSCEFTDGENGPHIFPIYQR